MRFFLFAFNVLLFCFSLTAVADDGPGLVYRVTPDNATVECRGKLFVTATLTNKSDAPVTVHWGDYLGPRPQATDPSVAASQLSVEKLWAGRL